MVTSTRNGPPVRRSGRAIRIAERHDRVGIRAWRNRVARAKFVAIRRRARVSVPSHRGDVEAHDREVGEPTVKDRRQLGRRPLFSNQGGRRVAHLGESLAPLDGAQRRELDAVDRAVKHPQVLPPDPQHRRLRCNSRQPASLGGRRPHLLDRRARFENPERRCQLEPERGPVVGREPLQTLGRRAVRRRQHRRPRAGPIRSARGRADRKPRRHSGCASRKSPSARPSIRTDGCSEGWTARYSRYETVESLVTDDGMRRRKILGEAVEQPEEVHVRIDVEPLERAQALVAMEPPLEAARQRALTIGQRGERRRDALRRADQPPEDVLSLSSLVIDFDLDAPRLLAPPLRPRKTPGSDRRARSRSRAVRTAGRPRA